MSTTIIVNTLCYCSAANSCPASPRGGSGRRNISADLHMVAAYAAAATSHHPVVATSSSEDGGGGRVMSMDHGATPSSSTSDDTPKLYRAGPNGTATPMATTSEPYSPPKVVSILSKII